jgi:hypothetical protein
MWAARLRTAMVAATLLAGVPGCVTLSGDRPVTVLVRDAETLQPISGAEVSVGCPLTRSFAGPSLARATTEADGLSRGLARLQVGPNSDSVTLMQIEAHGYLTESKELAADAIAAIDRPGWFERLDRRPPSFTVDLYAAPRPQVELTVPVGFRGAIKARTEIADAGATIGQRNFNYPVMAGEAVVRGPALLRHLAPSDFSARFGNGLPLVRNAKEGAVGLWWLRKETDVDVFFVGTESECNAAIAADKAGGSGGRSSGGSTGGGRGHKSRPGSL